MIIVIGLFVPAHASAAVERTKITVDPQNDFVVEPGKTEIFLNPGESIVKRVTITSRVNKTVHFKLTTEDLVGSDDPTQTVILLGDERGPYSLKDLIRPEITEFSLTLGERITIPVTITAPSDVEPRGYYGALIVANDPDKIETGTATEARGQTRIVSRIGSLFLVKINGEGKEEGALADFKVIGPKKLIHEKRPEGFEIAFKNTGTVHLVPYGRIVIKNMFGRVVDELPVDAYFVLPNATRYRQVEWSGGFGFGPYTASLSVYKGYGNEYEEGKLTFWILPWKILVALFVGIIMFVGIFYYISTRFELRKKK
jgi:hypothetical protein